MVSKGITLLAQTAMFNEDIRYWRLQTNNQKTWAHFKILFHQAHFDQRKAVTTAGKGGYTVAVQNIYSVPLPPPEEHYEAIDNLHTISQGMHTHSYEVEELSQFNEVLTIYNTSVMSQLAHINVTMNTM